MNTESRTVKFRWYIIQTYAGSEAKVMEKIKEDAERKGLLGCLGELYIPKEKVSSINKMGKKVVSERNVYPGYIFVYCDLENDYFHSMIKNTDKVSGLLSSSVGGKPVVVKQSEIDNIKEQSEASLTKEIKDEFGVGEVIEIRDGTFGGFHGTIKDVDITKKSFQVEVTILGRPIRVDLEESNIRKIGGEDHV